ncbi:MAG: bifunctional nuclease family protein [Armatimonadetes bacterium]|nr:bifunctional nuclease family protein [Armatimonadota bacterium]MDW8122539.1 bifunctional nuclease family protein [Armatimonadota bacterium]
MKVKRREILKVAAGALSSASLSGLAILAGSSPSPASPADRSQRVVVKDLLTDPIGAPVVLLGPERGNRALRVLIGESEARAILHALRGIQPPRPITHDLLKTVIRALGGKVERVTITDLRENTFYATVALTGPKGPIEVDSRPSDAIALALRTQAPIFLSSKLTLMMEPIPSQRAPAPSPLEPSQRKKRGISA